MKEKCKNGEHSKLLKQACDKIEENSKFIEEKRSKAEFKFSDMDSVVCLSDICLFSLNVTKLFLFYFFYSYRPLGKVKCKTQQHRSLHLFQSGKTSAKSSIRKNCSRETRREEAIHHVDLKPMDRHREARGAKSSESVRPRDRT